MLMNDDIASYLTTWPADLSPKQAASRIAAAEERLACREAIEFAILRRATEQLIGWISFLVERPGSRTMTVGFWLGRDYQGQGFMSEAGGVAVPIAADFLRATTLMAYVYPWNAPSIGLLRKLGFKPEGGAALYSPVRKRSEEAFVFCRKLEQDKSEQNMTIPLEQWYVSTY